MPKKINSAKYSGVIYASEADLLNLAVFGMTAKEWRDTNPNLKGNIRDNSTPEQLLVLANIENLNAQFIKQGLKQEERLEQLNEIAIYQMEILLQSSKIVRLSDTNTQQLPKNDT